MNMTTLNTPLPEDLMKLKWNGQFKLMQKMIDLRLQILVEWCRGSDKSGAEVLE